MGGWESFAVAQIGASAALAGLIFVGVSVNLESVLKTPGAPGRAGEALLVLLQLLIVNSLILVPDQPLSQLGLELLAIGIITWLAVIGVQWRSYSVWSQTHLAIYAPRLLLGQLATLPFIATGIGLLLRGEGAMGWLAVGVIGAFLVAFGNAWVLLVEIKR